MKKIILILALCALFVTTASAADLETRTYDEGGENLFYLSMSISNVAWDSIEEIPSVTSDYMAWLGVDDLAVNLENRPLARTIDRIKETSASNDYLYIGAAAPCVLNFEAGGVPHILKLTPYKDDESTIGTISIGENRYNAENVEYEDGMALPEGLYLLNNYMNDTYDMINSYGVGMMYWYDLILNVQSPDTITNADAYVSIVTHNLTYESKTMIAFKNQVPVIRNERTLVPMRDIFERLGCQVAWDENTQTITATSENGTVIVMKIDSNTMTKDGAEIVLDTPPMIINNSTMVPVRAVSEALDMTVEWDGAAKTVSIHKYEY